MHRSRASSLLSGAPLIAAALLLAACPEDPADDDDTAADDDDADDDDAADDDDSAGDDDDSAGDDDDAADDDDSAGDDDDSADPPPTLHGECGLAERFGRFTVEALPTYSAVQGGVADGVAPATVLEELMSAGGCSVLRQNLLVCEPACDPGFACDPQGQCVPAPTPQAVGTVSIDGLADSVSMEPIPPGMTYFDVSLPLVPFSPGAPVHLQASGGDHPAFELWGIGFTPLELPPEYLVQVVPGADLPLTWPAPPGGGGTELEVELFIDIHGLEPSRLFCVFPDTGSATIPQAAVDGLIAAGVSGFPEATLRRRTSDKTAFGAGCVDLLLTSPRASDIDVEGFYPCNRAIPCPEGMTCNLEIELCE